MFHVISIHTFLAEGDDEMMYNYDISFISIHTFLAEGDCKFAGGIWTRWYFNPHLPCGRWQHKRFKKISPDWFQSTPSLRKVTFMQWNTDTLSRLFQSTPSLRKVTCSTWLLRKYCSWISIHTFLAEGDLSVQVPIWLKYDFNPHLPCGRWPISTAAAKRCWTISIHTFLAEGDYSSGTYSTILYYFNPHLPCGRWH